MGRVGYRSFDMFYAIDKQKVEMKKFDKMNFKDANSQKLLLSNWVFCSHECSILRFSILLYLIFFRNLVKCYITFFSIILR